MIRYIASSWPKPQRGRIQLQCCHHLRFGTAWVRHHLEIMEGTVEEEVTHRHRHHRLGRWDHLIMQCHHHSLGRDCAITAANRGTLVENVSNRVPTDVVTTHRDPWIREARNTPLAFSVEE